MPVDPTNVYTDMWFATDLFDEKENYTLDCLTENNESFFLNMQGTVVFYHQNKHLSVREVEEFFKNVKPDMIKHKKKQRELAKKIN